MISCGQFRKFIIRPALNIIQLYSPSSEELLISTMAQESLGGFYIEQVGPGPAMSVFQMEPGSHNYLWTLLSKPEYFSQRKKILEFFNMPIDRDDENVLIHPPAEVMIHNLFYATMMARMFYRVQPEKLPDHDDLEGIWSYYKKYWNTIQGKATKEQFFRNYRLYIGDKL